MSKVQIIGVPQSNYVRTVRIAAEEMGIAYDLLPERPHSPAVDAIHPLGKVPVMRHGDVALCESRAIIAYFENAFAGPNLIPADARLSAQVEQWASLLTTSFIPHLIGEYLFAYLFPGTADGSPDRARVEAAMPKLERYLAILDEEAGKTGFIGAESFSIADAYLIPVLDYLKALPESGGMIGAGAGLSSYVALHASRPSVKATLPEAVSAEDRERGARILAGAAA